MKWFRKKERGDAAAQDHHLIENLIRLPHKIVRHHEVDGLAQIVLHELGHDSHFNLSRAIYLIDNPDFDCAKGVAGYCKNECEMHQKDVWQDPHSFADDMKDAEFHRRLESFLHTAALRRKDIDAHHPDEVRELGEKMGMKNPSFFSWPMRHGNHGILIFEEVQPNAARRRELLSDASAFLSLC